MSALLKDMDLYPGPEQVDADAGVIVTDWMPFRRFPPSRARNVRFGKHYSPTQFRLHVFVPQFAEPARVYIDAVVKARAATRQTKIFYRILHVSQWLLDDLEARLGERGIPVPEKFLRRQRLAEALLGAEAVARLGGPVPEDVLNSEPGLAGVAGVTNPARIPASYVSPVYPYSKRIAREKGRVVMTAIVTEDGCVRDIEVLREPKASGELTVSAREAAALWRYRPCTKGGRNVPARIMVIVDYTL